MGHLLSAKWGNITLQIGDVTIRTQISKEHDISWRHDTGKDHVMSLGEQYSDSLLTSKSFKRDTPSFQLNFTSPSNGR